MKKNVRFHQHLVTCVHLSTAHWTPRRELRKFPSIFPARMYLHLQMWKMRSLKWQKHPMMVLLKIQAWQWGRHNLMSPIATKICSSESIRITTLRFYHAIWAMLTLFLAHITSLRMDPNTSDEHFPAQPPPRQTIPRHMKILCRVLFEFLRKMRLWFSWMGSIAFKCCSNFRRREILLAFNLFCWYGVSSTRISAKSRKWEHSSWVTLQKEWSALCVTNLFYCSREIFNEP